MRTISAHRVRAVAAVWLAIGLCVRAPAGAASPEEGKMSVRTEKAVFAAGCFWGIEEAFRRVPGVVKTTAGYTGGWTKNPTYEEVCTNRTGHAESVLVEYDPRKVTYGKLLEVFWRIHDPTALNRQGPDIGAQYRSAIFYADDAQKKAALASKEALGRSGTFAKPIVTEIAPLGAFYPAEEYHQGYYRKNGPGSCHVPGL